MVRPTLVHLYNRKIVHWGIAYLAGAWLVLQVLDLFAQPFAWPSLVLRAATVVLGIGFFAALVLAWYHGEKGAQRVTGVELLMLTGILVIAGAAVAFVSGRGSAPAVVEPAAAGVAEQGSIAVLPFADMSPGKDQEYFTDGLTEELLNALAKLPELRVASRTSAFAFKGKDVSVDSVARALRVASVLEGSVRKEGSSIRVTAQLIDAKSGYHVWSDTYDRELSGVFALQDEIARKITEALQLKLGGSRATSPLVAEETSDPEAHTLVLKATYLRRTSTREAVQESVRLLEQAIARDPSYARAHSELSRALSTQAYRRFGPQDSLLARAKREAERAVQLAPDRAESHYGLGLLARDQWDLRAAESHYRKAVELDPQISGLRSERGWLLMQLGQPEEAIAESKAAVELDPVSSNLLNNLGAMYLYARDFEQGEATMRQALQLQPNEPVTLGNLALVLTYRGQLAEAIATAEQARLHGPDDQFVVAVLSYVYARAGRRADAERMLRNFEAMPEPSPYMLATAYAGLGDRERVFALLEQAIEEKDVAAQDLGVDPSFDAYRSDPRLAALLRRAGLR